MLHNSIFYVLKQNVKKKNDSPNFIGLAFMYMQEQNVEER